MINQNCDGSGPCHPGQVRVLPIDADSALIRCAYCYRREITHRRERNKQLTKDCQFALPSWDALKVYAPAK